MAIIIFIDYLSIVFSLQFSMRIYLKLFREVTYLYWFFLYLRIVYKIVTYRWLVILLHAN